MKGWGNHMANLFKWEAGKYGALMRLFAERLTIEEGEKLLQNPGIVDRMIAALRIPEEGHLYRGGSDKPASTELTHSLFTPIQAQIVRVRELNLERGWGFTEDDFAEAEASVPEWPSGKLVAVTLVPYLPDANDMGGVERTFQELWKVAASLQHKSWRWNGYDKAGPDTLRLLKGIQHSAQSKPVLHWEVIDLGCNSNREPADIRNPETSPHAGILAVAALHPEWIKAMDGDEVPYVWAPGYEVNVSGKNPWQNVPNLYFIRYDRKIKLNCHWYDCHDSGWTVPSFARE